MKLSGFFLLILVPALVAQADVAFLEKRINVTNEMSHWNWELVQRVMDNSDLKKTGLIECAEVNELLGAVFCASTKKSYMNKALTRASIFSEGTLGVDKGKVLSTDSNSYSQLVSLALGHDIPSEALLHFWQQLDQACQRNETCPTPEEKEFFDKIVIPISQHQDKFVIITYAIESEWYQTVTHELAHAQYFLNARFRQTVDEFWNKEVTSTDREAIKKALSQGYNPNDEFVIRNEFQAYLLDSQATVSWLKAFAPIYRDRLIRALTHSGTTPIQINP